MRKKTALISLLCAVCIALVGIAIMAGISRQQQTSQQAQEQQQQEQTKEPEQTEQLSSQQEIETYRDDLEDTFDTLLNTESGIQTESNGDERQALIDAIESAGSVMEQLSEIDAPQALADAQQHFVNASETYQQAAEKAVDVLSDETQDNNALAASMMSLLPDILESFDEIKSGINELEENGVEVPDSAKQFAETIENLLDSEDIP